MRYIVALCVFLGLMCCTARPAAREPLSGEPVVAYLLLHGDLDFEPAEREAIDRAAAALTHATAGAVRVKIAWDLDWREIRGAEKGLVLKVSAVSEFIREIDKNGTMLGVTSPELRHVFLVTDRLEAFDADLESVALHEFLHLFSVPHLDVPGAAMRPVYTGQRCLSRIDVQALCSLVHCAAEKSNTCG